MPKLSNVTLNAEVLEAALAGLGSQRERIEEQIRQVQNLLGRRPGRPPGRSDSSAAPQKRRGISAAGRRRIAIAQKQRWAALKKSGSEKPAPKPGKKRKLSAAGRAKMAAAARKRWSKVKKAARTKTASAAATKSVKESTKA